MTDLTRKKDFSEKKGVSVASARINHGDVADTALNTLYNLPANAVIIDAFVIVEVAGQAGLTVDFGFTGGDELGDAIDLSAVAVKSGISPASVNTLTTLTGTITELTLTEGTPNTLDSGTITLTSGEGTGIVTPAPRIATLTGKDVTAKFSEDPTAGTFVFVVEFIEYDLGTGNLMNVTRAEA